MTDIDRTAQLERVCTYLRRIPAWYLATTDASDGHLAFFSVRNIAARFCDIDGSEELLEL